jgi:hypothetical protein
MRLLLPFKLLQELHKATSEPDPIMKIGCPKDGRPSSRWEEQHRKDVDHEKERAKLVNKKIVNYRVRTG